MKTKFLGLSLLLCVACFSSVSAQSGQRSSSPNRSVNDQSSNSSTDKTPTTRSQGSQISSDAPQSQPVRTNQPSGSTGQQANTPKPAQNNSSRGRASKQ